MSRCREDIQAEIDAAWELLNKIDPQTRSGAHTQVMVRIAELYDMLEKAPRAI